MTTTVDTSTIPGNASSEVKDVVSRVVESLRDSAGFSNVIYGRLELEEISMVPKAEEPKRKDARVVCGLTVDSDCMNARGHIHGGCSAFLIDVCSTLACVAYGIATGQDGEPGVSLSLDVLYHAPAEGGERLKIVNTTLSVGGRAMTARTEIWNTTTNRLVASGVHVKMKPSAAKSKL